MRHPPAASAGATLLSLCLVAGTASAAGGPDAAPDIAPDPIGPVGTPDPSRSVTSGPPPFLILGVASLPDYLGSDDHVLLPLVAAAFGLGPVGVAFQGTELRIDVVPGAAWSAGPLANFARGRDDDVDSDRVAALPEIDAALELGAYVGFERGVDAAGRGSVSGSLSLRGTVSDDVDGAIARASLGYAYALTPRLRLSVDASANAADGDWMSSWFGVDAQASVDSALRPFDAGGGARDVGLGASATYSFSPRFGAYAGASWSRLVWDARDSPVTRDEGDASQWFGGVGLLWSR